MLNRLRPHLGFILFLLALGTFRGSIADWNVVPTGSMKPTIVEGDVIWLDRLAYDINLPFSTIHLAKRGEPQRGDVVVFESARADMRLVKRVVGIPGDVIQMRNNRLTINGVLQERTALDERDGYRQYREDLSGSNHAIQTAENTALAGHDFGPVQVPPGHLLVLGDNRDNSADSRYYGFVPRNELVGRATGVLASFDPDRNYLPRLDRFFSALD